MCHDKKCPMRKDCFRATAEENPHRQSFFSESPRKGKKCDYFWDNTRVNKKDWAD